MTFTTLTFVIFLLLFFIAYWCVPSRRVQNLLIVLGSYFFYGWWDWRFCGLMLGTSLLDFAVGLALDRTANQRGRRALLWASIVANLGVLGFFKYFNFFAENFIAMAGSVGWKVDAVTVKILLPVGISFYTFQTMSYVLDIYARRIRATPQWIEYLAYVSFFPQLVAGPIERATHLLPQFFRDRVFDQDRAVDGCRQMLWGFFKKMVIADNLAPVVDAAFSDPGSRSGGELALATVFFAFQIYCDFSAYSDIAIGTARLFGFELMRNFALPYFAQSPGEFWRRWHISLTTWFKDYVYVPLGGSRTPPRRRAGNVLLTFLLSGLWHGASWNFLAWGALNGLGVLPGILADRSKRRVTDTPGGEAMFPSLRTLARMGFTFGFVCVGWIFFRSRTLADALHILGKIVMDAFALETYFIALAGVAEQPAGNFVFLALGVLILAEWMQRRKAHPLTIGRWPRPLRWAVYLGLSATILFLGTFGSNEFIYFQF